MNKLNYLLIIAIVYYTVISIIPPKPVVGNGCMISRRVYAFDIHCIPYKPYKPRATMTQKYYFTSYNLTKEQTDDSPCIGASGVDLCERDRKGLTSIAITSDIRKLLGIKFGDTVRLTGDAGCAGVHQVHDEMGLRFRTRCIYRPGTKYCIKGDIVNRPGGACSISKMN